MREPACVCSTETHSSQLEGQALQMSSVLIQRSQASHLRTMAAEWLGCVSRVVSPLANHPYDYNYNCTSLHASRKGDLQNTRSVVFEF